MDEKSQVDRDAKPMLQRIREIQQHLADHERTGFPADKAFFDELSGDAEADDFSDIAGARRLKPTPR